MSDDGGFAIEWQTDTIPTVATICGLALDKHRYTMLTRSSQVLIHWPKPRHLDIVGIF